MGKIEPRRLSESDLAYLRFIFLAVQSSIKEARYSSANRALVLDVFNGIDLLIENAARRFGFPLLPPGRQVAPPAPPKTLAYQLSLEARPCLPAFASSLRPQDESRPTTPHEEPPV